MALENCLSTLLEKTENDDIFSRMNPNSLSLSTAVVQLYFSRPPKHTEWIKKFQGAVCLTRDGNRKSYFIQMFDLE
ncbi:hypothetical protein MXB_4889, partial [Myxobolus squamalis]